MLEIFSFISKVKAANLPNIDPVTPPASRFSDVNGVVGAAITTVIEVASGLLVIAIIYSGIMYITSGGDQEKAEKAKKNLIWTVTGLVVMLLSVVIIQWVQTMLTTNAP